VRKRYNLSVLLTLAVLLSLVALSSASSWADAYTFGSAPSISGDSTATMPEIFVGDYDEDGKSDLGLFWSSSNSFDVLLSTGKRFGGSDSGQWSAPGVFGHAGGQFYVGDYSGDGRSDLGFFEPGNNSFHVSKSTGTSFGGAGSGQWIAPNAFGNRGGTYYVGFYNGGAKADLGFFEPSNNAFYVSLSTGSSFNAPDSGQWSAPNAFGNAGGQFLIGDYNGDGSQDLGFFEPSNNTFSISYSYKSESFGGPSSGLKIGPGEFGHNEDGRFYVGDFNGDGRADLGFFEPADNSFYVALSSGTSFPPSGRRQWVSPNAFGHAGGEFYVGDYDGDVKDDLGFYDPGANAFRVSLSDGSKFKTSDSSLWARFQIYRIYVPLVIRRR
jgi:hypothetical protein